MPLLTNAILCRHCDAAHQRPTLSTHETAHCTRCGHSLVRVPAAVAGQILLLSVGALVSFLVSLACPVLIVTVQGSRVDLTLWRLATAVAKGAWATVAYPLATLIVLAPVLQVTLVSWLMAFASRGLRAPYSARVAWLSELLRHGIGAEVMIVALVIAVIQVTPVAQVDLGAGLVLFGFGGALSFAAARWEAWLLGPRPLPTLLGPTTVKP